MYVLYVHTIVCTLVFQLSMVKGNVVLWTSDFHLSCMRYTIINYAYYSNINTYIFY